MPRFQVTPSGRDTYRDVPIGTVPPIAGAGSAGSAPKIRPYKPATARRGGTATVIRQRGNQWCLLSADGSKTLGCHPTRAAAEAQERTVKAAVATAHSSGLDAALKVYMLAMNATRAESVRILQSADDADPAPALGNAPGFRGGPNAAVQAPNDTAGDDVYDVVQRDGQWCVVEVDGDTITCYEGEAQARATLQALRAAIIVQESGLDASAKVFSEAANVSLSEARRTLRGLRAFQSDGNEINGLPFFATGTHNGQPYTEKDLDDIVGAFGEVGFTPPFKRGHTSEADAPAWGWVKRIWREGSQLLADVANVPSELYEAIKQRRYGPTSAELYVNLEKDGRKFPKVLKAISILGADVPAVPNLTPAWDVVNAKWGSVIEHTMENGQVNFAWQVGGSRGLPLSDDSSWDAGAAEASLGTDWGAWKRAHIVHDTSNPEQKGSYKFPFARMSGGKLVASKSGLQAARQRLSSSDIPNKSAAASFIDSYLGKMNGAAKNAIYISREEMMTVCAPCAAKMADLGYTVLKIPVDEQGNFLMENMSSELLQGLCTKYGPAEGFSTRCVDNPPPTTSDRAKFCQSLQAACFSQSSLEGIDMDDDTKALIARLEEEKRDLTSRLEAASKPEGDIGLGEGAVKKLRLQLEDKNTQLSKIARERRDERIAAKVASVKVPAFRRHVQALYEALSVPKDPITVKFSLEGKAILHDTQAVEVLDQFVANLNKHAEHLFHELAEAGLRADARESFTDDPGKEIDRRAKAMVIDKKMEYGQAVKAVLSDDHDLAEAYASAQAPAS